MKSLLSLLFFFLVVGNINAQVKVRPGIKTGLNLANITNTTLDYKAGINAGAFAHIKFSEIYTMQPEILYSNQGGSQNGENVSIHYLSIGLGNKLFVAKNVGFHFLLGPSIDINLENNLIDLTNDEFDFDNEFSGVDISIFGGVGYEFPFGLIIETRFKQGLINVDLFAENFEFYEEGNTLNAVFQLSVAYKFDW